MLSRIIRRSRVPGMSVFAREMFRRVFERVVEACIAAGLVGGEGFAVDASLILGRCQQAALNRGSGLAQGS
jgi:transposase